MKATMLAKVSGHEIECDSANRLQIICTSPAYSSLCTTLLTTRSGLGKSLHRRFFSISSFSSVPNDNIPIISLIISEAVIAISQGSNRFVAY